MFIHCPLCAANSQNQQLVHPCSLGQASYSFRFPALKVSPQMCTEERLCCNAEALLGRSTSRRPGVLAGRVGCHPKEANHASQAKTSVFHTHRITQTGLKILPDQFLSQSKIQINGHQTSADAMSLHKLVPQRRKLPTYTAVRYLVTGSYMTKEIISFQHRHHSKHCASPSLIFTSL